MFEWAGRGGFGYDCSVHPPTTGECSYSGQTREGIMEFDSRFFFSALGLAFILEALPYLLFPERMLEVLRSMGEGDAARLRRMGLTALGAGLAVLLFTLG